MTKFSRVDTWLANVVSTTPRRGNLIFALDATASREGTWDAACQLQAQMFREVATIGTLSMQLVYYRGVRGMGGECKASRWVDDPMVLAGAMSKIKCDAGETRSSKCSVMPHEKPRSVRSTPWSSSAMPVRKNTISWPRGPPSSAKLGIPAFTFQEGSDRIAQLRFEEIARLTHGAYHRFDAGSLVQLAELLRAVSVFAVGGTAALERQGSAAAPSCCSDRSDEPLNL